ncbi:MAG: hypothetical protein ABIS47_06580 [Acidimicrobiales bacterium]
MLALQGAAGNQAVAGLMLQRGTGAGAVKDKPGPSFDEELRLRVAQTPELGAGIPAPEKVQEAGQEAREDLEVLKVAQGKEALGAVIEGLSSAPAAPAQEGAQQPAAPTQQAAPAAPGRLARMGASVKGFFSGIKKALTPSDVTAAQIGGGAETAAKGAYATATTGGSVLGQTANVLNLIGQGAAAATPAVVAISHIVPLIGIFMAPITLCLNGFQAGKAWDRAARLEELLQDANGKARATGAPAEVVDAVRGAIEQKYEQARRKAKMTLATLLSLTGGLLLLTATLATNPVGWVIGAALAVIGGAYGFYCAARAIYRSFKKKDKGAKRRQIAEALVRGARSGDALAQQAIRELGLNPDTVVQKGGEALLFKRLTTA